MVNVLLEGFNINKPWLFNELKNHLKPRLKVVVIPFSFRDSEVKNSQDWEKLYGKGGYVYCGIVGGLKTYGIAENDVYFINYFTDDKDFAAQKVKKADVIYFTGGLPDKMMQRIENFNLTGVLKSFDKIIMGYSAGALIQLGEYHLSPDKDYSNFTYFNGLGYLNGFYLEVHYNATAIQNDSIKRVKSERKLPVFATKVMEGAIIAENGKIKLLGAVERF
ncbi:MAG: Type 1 glutamine amidotransferase-like domain-containing protein [Clostridia bacterium]|nr:Type 1 glutamine amidotransferase-like domain-containing protein [Clostridia bacterium]